MNHNTVKFFLMLVIFSLFIVACSGQDSEAVQDAVAQGVAATLTKEAWLDGLEEEAQQTEEVIETVTPSPEPIIHEMIPGEPQEKANTYLTDFNSIDNAEAGFTYGDQFLINRFERPFTIEMEQYRGYLDIILANMMVNPPWIYVEIFLADQLPESSEAFYSIELDLDVDGRGDFLIQTRMPENEEWTVVGVRVFEDSDGDVGGENPVFSDPADENITGYELVIFDEGRGDDPDLAWVRRNPDDETNFQIAFKVSLTDALGFLWSVWADEGLRDPALFDYNDRYSFEEAGSPYPEHEFHPIQAINLVDSTCRSWYGFEPEGDEPGLCQVYYKAGPDKGWKLCYRVSDTFSVCSDVCLIRCPRELPSRWFCERCKLPKAE